MCPYSYFSVAVLSKALLLLVVFSLLIYTVRFTCCVTFSATNPQAEGAFPFNSAYITEVRACLRRY